MPRLVTLFTGQWADLPLAERTLAEREGAEGYLFTPRPALSVTVSREDDAREKKRKTLYEVMELAAQYFQATLAGREGAAVSRRTWSCVGWRRRASRALARRGARSSRPVPHG